MCTRCAAAPTPRAMDRARCPAGIGFVALAGIGSVVIGFWISGPGTRRPRSAVAEKFDATIVPLVSDAMRIIGCGT